MELSTYLSFLAATILLIAIPGPTVLTIVSDGLNQGTRKSIRTILGAATAHTCYIAVTAFGINEILLMSVDYFVALKWIGASYLIILGIKRLLSKEAAMDLTEKKGKAGSLYLKGLLVTLGNPKAIIFYATFFPPFLNPNLRLDLQYAIFGSSFLLIFLVLSFASVIFATRLFQGLVKKNRQQTINRVSGGMMIGAGLLLASIKKS